MYSTVAMASICSCRYCNSMHKLFVSILNIGPILQVSGNKFYYLKNEAVLLEMALISWTLSKVLPKGFVPLSTPDLVRSTVVEKCGFQPRGQNTQVGLDYLVSLFITVFSEDKVALCQDVQYEK